jgi:hypothetical protein
MSKPAGINRDKFFSELLDGIKASTIDANDISKLLNLVERSKTFIYGEYLGICRLASYYMEDKDKDLDRHKLGACMALAFMDKLNIPPDKKACEPYREELAIMAGLKAMGTILEVECVRDSGLIALLLENKGFVLPPQLCDHDNYIKSWAYRLGCACEQNVNRGILVLFLAAELFHIESYNRMLAEK